MDNIYHPLVDDYCSQPNPYAESRAAQAYLHLPAVVTKKNQKNKKITKT
jgi:hypothetical protein